MRKYTILLIVLLVCTLAYAAQQVRWFSLTGQEIDPGVAYTPQARWQTAGTITVAESALAVGNRTTTYSEALASTKNAVITWPDGTTIGAVRLITDDDADAWVINIYRRAKDDVYWNLMSTLSLTGGTQVYGTTDVFVDTIAASVDYTWAGLTVTNTGNDCIAEIYCDTLGDAQWLVIATTIQATKTLTVQNIVKSGGRQ